VLGTSIYALGITGGVATFFRALARGEIHAVTRLIYEARENCLEHMHREAETLGADGVIGTKVYIYEIGSGLVEVMAIGTAIRRNSALTTQSAQLIPQAIIRDRDTFFDETHKMGERKLERQ
jgi:uncharacterized protein YbjQ (UPF0145 family)